MIFSIPNGYSSEVFSLDKGSAKTIRVKRNIKTVFISNPKIADYKVIDENKVVIYGVDVGDASVIVYDRSGNELYNAELIVNKSLRLLKQTIVARYPDEEISIMNIGEQVVLDGLVSSDEIKNSIYDAVGTMLKKERITSVIKIHDKNEGDVNGLEYSAKNTYVGIINNLKVLSTNQINVKLTVAEVSSSFLTKLGVKYSDAFSTDTAGTIVQSVLDFTAKDIVAIISAKGDDKIGQVLAEPNLSVISGENASFLVGGEIPLAVRDRDGIKIIYKEYGVKLSMVAKVTDSDNIRLTLMPEVSSLDESFTQNNAFASLPSLKTRRAQTTVQLQDGQSFVLAGLLTTEEMESLSRVPVLGDIPLLGALFSHTESNKVKTELIIVATVNLVTPVKSEKIKLPSYRSTNDLKRLFRINFTSEDSKELESTIESGGFN
ncbi:pilus assembly protein N-terminal domain-containing protein [Photobacterium sanguinicancri]|uniref:Pilus assembly protein N-terminal domain-containing protein n=2 Tax=Photobacterium sanguinicancri TaxID=875932 RepID=A0AAW7Y3G3_9GAMM|nr:pilus assembly protein N-terminal domain-containing protein [Photobacterium sanguinicancri]MDO6542896.1 pilus assembly protein N-terminal domain-containing protein [Photobacterium sanguinicancri]